MLTVCCLPYGNEKHWKMSSLYCWVSFACNFCQRLYCWVQLLKARTRPLPKLVSTDPLGLRNPCPQDNFLQKLHPRDKNLEKISYFLLKTVIKYYHFSVFRNGTLQFSFFLWLKMLMLSDTVHFNGSIRF